MNQVTSNNFFKHVNLAGGRRQIVPGDIELLNPQREGKVRCLYFVWAYDQSSPCDLGSTAKGHGLAPLFGFFTDHVDFYVMGRHDTPVLRSHFEAMQPDYQELLGLMMERVGVAVPSGVTWSYAFCLCSCMGDEVPIGTGFSIKKEKGDA